MSRRGVRRDRSQLGILTIESLVRAPFAVKRRAARRRLCPILNIAMEPNALGRDS
jgi:hypothetical protein